MTDFDYNAMKQKQIANGARNRKCGSKSKRCSLPSDHLSEREWRAKCGKMIAYRMNEPMTWDDFKALANSSQREYIEYLRDTYGATAVSLGEMFGVSPLTVRRVASRIGVEFRKGQHMSKQKQTAWDRFISGEDTVMVDEPVLDALPQTFELPPVEAAQPLVKIEPTPESPAKMTRFSIRFDGRIDVAMIANSLLHILGENSNGVVEIQCELA